MTLPLFPIVNRLGLNDTHLVLILLYATFFVSLGTLLMRTFIDQIPRELDEAAMVDGGESADRSRADHRCRCRGRACWRVAVFVIVYAWNEFLFAFIFTSTRAKTAPLVISEMIGSFDGVDWGVLFAASTHPARCRSCSSSSLMQRHLVAGLTAGATKGEHPDQQRRGRRTMTRDFTRREALGLGARRDGRSPRQRGRPRAASKTLNVLVPPRPPDRA